LYGAVSSDGEIIALKLYGKVNVSNPSILIIDSVIWICGPLSLTYAAAAGDVLMHEVQHESRRPQTAAVLDGRWRNDIRRYRYKDHVIGPTCLFCSSAMSD